MKRYFAYGSNMNPDRMIERGVTFFTIIDRCPGLIRVAKEVFPGSDIQRCTRHKIENILNKVLKEDREKVKESLRKIFYASTYKWRGVSGK